MQVMKNLKTLTITLLMLSLICGCSSKKYVEKYNISVIAGNNSCSLLHDYSLAKPYLDKTYTQGGQLSIVNSDGNPYVVKSEQIEAIKSYTTSTQKKAYLEKYSSDTIKVLNVKPKSAEIDLIESLNCASNSFKSNSNNNIICFVSGLSTKGLLNMTTLGSLSNLDINKTVSNLKEVHGLPKLENINNIYLYSVGQVGLCQNLSTTSIHKLKEFLTKLLVESGMNKDKIHFIDSNPISNKTYKGSPKVSKVGQDTNYNAVSMVSNNYNDIKKKFCLTGLEFEKNSSCLLNEEKLNSVVSFLSNYAGAVNIYGTTAFDKTTSDERLQKLGYERALVVKNKLLEKGVDPNKINKISSWSYNNIYHLNEWSNQGFNEEIAKMNRTVVIKDSET